MPQRFVSSISLWQGSTELTPRAETSRVSTADSLSSAAGVERPKLDRHSASSRDHCREECQRHARHPSILTTSRVIGQGCVESICVVDKSWSDKEHEPREMEYHPRYAETHHTRPRLSPGTTPEQNNSARSTQQQPKGLLEQLSLRRAGRIHEAKLTDASSSLRHG